MKPLPLNVLSWFASVRKCLGSNALNCEAIIDAMYFCGLGIGSRTWLVELKVPRCDYALMVFGSLLLFGSVLTSLFGYGKFWVPPVLLNALGG